MNKVNVVDSIMGSYKTTAAINKMNKEKDRSFIFITPFLKEVDRIKECCPDRKFFDPVNKGGGKLENLHELLNAKANIASTHVLFKRYNDSTMDYIRKGNYVLILDEVLDVLVPSNITPSDFNILKKSKTISIENGFKVSWESDDYIDGEFLQLKSMSRTGGLCILDNSLLMWKYPVEIFDCFRESYILTYMFDAQVQKYYFDLNNVEINYLGVENTEGEYVFSKNGQVPESVKSIKNKIRILDDEKINTIGAGYYNLSKSWYDRDKKNSPFITQLKKNLYTVYRHKFNATIDNFMWTTYKDYLDVLSQSRYNKCFVAINAKATNEYRDRFNLAYLSNVFFNPCLKSYCMDNGIKVQEEKYALSELIQWIWRSRIRQGQDINIYIPSIRMRRLLIEWLETLEKM